MAGQSNVIPVPVTIESPFDGAITGLPLTLPGYGAGTPTPGSGSVIATFPYFDWTTKAWVYPGTATIGPSSDPNVPDILAEIDYKPLTTARLGAPIPVLYGRGRIGGLIARAKTTSTGSLRLLMVWSEGLNDAIEKVYSDEIDITPDYQSAAYLGAATQTPDSYIYADFGQADALNGICYSVLRLPAGYSLNLTAVIRGKKVYDPRTATTVYSTNAALCLADFIVTYAGLAVDWPSVITAADYCDEIITGAIKRWEIGMVLADRKTPEEWIAVLAEYANCYVFIDNGSAKLVPDRARAVDHVLTAADIRAGTFDLAKSGQRDTPTQVFADYLLPDANDIWSEAEVFTPDVSSPNPLRITRLNMGGYFRAIHAQRKATQFLNYANLADLSVTFEMFDLGAKITKGDVISITHPVGLTAKEFRVLDVQALPHGRWRIDAREYSTLLYSTEVVADPNIPDSDLPDPTAIPVGPTPSVVEKNVLMDTGVTGTYLEVSFTGATWPFTRQYRVKVYTGSTVLLNVLIAHLGAVTHTVSTPQLAEGVAYIVEVFIVNIFGGLSAVAGTVNYTSIGKLVPPTNPTNMSGYEAGQNVFLTWTRSIDKDLAGYKIRRLTKALYDAAIIALADPWAHASAVTIVERSDSTTYLTPSQPVGEFYYMVKAVDSGNRQSAGYASCYINVTADAVGGTGIERVMPDRCVITPDYVPSRYEVPDNALYDPGTANFTVEGWIEADFFGAGGVGIIEKYNTGPAGWSLAVVGSAAGAPSKKIAWTVNDGTNNAFGYSTNALTENVNYHIAMVVSRSTNQLRIYINGTEDAASPFSIATVTGSLNNADAVFLAWAKDGYVHRYALRDIRYWSVARTAAEVADNRWRSFTSLPVTNLKGYWLMNDSSGNVANDSSGNAAHGTAKEDGGFERGWWSYFYLQRMHLFEIHGDSFYAVTSPRITWTAAGGLTSGQIWTYNAGDNSGDRWFDLMQTGTQTINASIETATFDAGRDVQGKWTSAPEITLFNGATEVRTMRLAAEATPGVFVDSTAASVQAIARYMRYRIEETSLLAAAGMLVRLPCQVSFQGRIVEDTQVISVAANPTAVVWAAPFSAIPQISLTLVGTAARILASNGLSKTGVDLYAWDAAGVAASATVRVTARGP